MKSVVLILLLFCLNSCSEGFFPIAGESNRALYSPKNEVECVPEKKGEILFKGNTSLDINALAQFNIAYSPISKLCINYNGAFGPLINSHAASFGYVHFKNISESRSNKYSWHAGLSYAPKLALNTDQDNIISASYLKYWLQNNYEFRDDNITYCVGLSGNFIDFRSFTVSSEIINQLQEEYITNDPFFTLESYLKLRYRKSFYGLDIGLNVLVVKDKPEPKFQRSGITTGFFLNISDLFTFLKNK